MARPRFTRPGIQEISIVRKDTGETLDFVFKPPQGMGGKWVRVFQDYARKLILNNPQFRGETHKVLAYLVTLADWRNAVPPPVQLASTLHMQRTSVYRAYAQLIEAGAILKVASSYYLNPELCWKGNEQQLLEAYQTVFSFLRMPESKPAGAIAEQRVKYDDRRAGNG